MDDMPPVSPEIASRYFDIDDEMSDFSASDAGGPAAPAKGKGPRPSTHFTDERADEYAAGGEGGDGAEAGEDARFYKDKRNTDDEFCKTVEYIPIRSKTVDYLTCQFLDEETEEETQKKRDEAVQHVEKARESNAAPDFLAYGEKLGEIKCLLCEIYLSERDREKDGGGESRKHPLLEAYMQLKMYDLRYCGFQAEPVIMQHCTSIFNQISGTYALNSKTEPRLLTQKETYQHLYHHDVSNPKRPILTSIAEVKYLMANVFNGCVGRTPSGRRVIRHSNIGAYSTLVRMRMDLNSRFIEASAHVNTQLSEGSGGSSGQKGAGGTKRKTRVLK